MKSKQILSAPSGDAESWKEYHAHPYKSSNNSKHSNKIHTEKETNSKSISLFPLSEREGMTRAYNDRGGENIFLTWDTCT